MKSVLHFAVFCLFHFLICSFQTTFWFQLFGQTPAPQLWLSILVYWSLYHSMVATLPMLYAITAISSSLSSAPAGSLLLLISALFGAIVFFKSRIYWSGPLYYLLVSGLTSLVAPLFYMIISWFVDDQPVRSFEFFHWVLSTLLTMTVSLALYRFYSLLDRLFLSDQLDTISGGNL